MCLFEIVIHCCGQKVVQIEEKSLVTREIRIKVDFGDIIGAETQEFKNKPLLQLIFSNIIKKLYQTVKIVENKMDILTDPKIIRILIFQDPMS